MGRLKHDWPFTIFMITVSLFLRDSKQASMCPISIYHVIIERNENKWNINKMVEISPVGSFTNMV